MVSAPQEVQQRQRRHVIFRSQASGVIVARSSFQEAGDYMNYMCVWVQALVPL